MSSSNPAKVRLLEVSTQQEILESSTAGFFTTKRKSSKSKKKKAIYITFCIVTTLLLGIGLTVYFVFFWDDSNHKKHKIYENCNYTNPQYPMAGGAGCAQACLPGNYSASLDYLYQLNDSFIGNMRHAGIILNETEIKPILIEQYKKPQLLPPQGIHITLDYFCCLNTSQLQLIDDIVSHWTYPNITVTFDELICTQDGKGRPYGEMVELVVMTSQESNEILMNITNAIEAEIIAQGVPIKVPRKENIGFHSTIAFVNGTLYPVNSVVEKINNRIKWSEGSGMIIGGTGIGCYDIGINGTNESYSCIHN